METRNPTYNARGTIDCEINHPQHGWIPFTANPDDVEPLGLEVYEAVKDTASPYVPPPVDLDRLAASVRAERDALLSSSDWTQMPDAPVDQEAWAQYRRELRAMTDLEGFPETLSWPVAPA